MKTSLTSGNVANIIAKHLVSSWKDVVDITLSFDGIWFTGSQVWQWLYNYPTTFGSSDLDIVIVNEDNGPLVRLPNYCKAEQVYDDLGKVFANQAIVQHKPTKYGKGNGVDILFNGRSIDMWWKNTDNVDEALDEYPETSHAHCRAAFNFNRGLVVLPNTQGWGP